MLLNSSCENFVTFIQELNDFITDYSTFSIDNNMNNISIICFPLSPKPHEVYETDIIIKKYWK